MRSPSSRTERKRPALLASSCGAVLLVLVLTTGARAATLVRGPYLQLATATSITVVWSTDVPAACSLVVHPAQGGAIAIDGTLGTTCVVTADGLAPGARYAYVPRANGIALTQQTTFSIPDAGSPYAFLVVGDSGSASVGQLRVRDRMLATPAAFVLHTGDMIYEDGAARDFDRKHFVPYRSLLRRMVLWPCLGNHDVVRADGAAWRDAFLTPANNAAGDEGYYSFDAGNAHVVVLDTNRSTSPGSLQYAFLEQDLAASTAPWKFVAFHHTIYSGGLHGSDKRIRANLLPLFDQYGVDVVFMGHDHHYERTLPLRGDLFVAAGMGTTYITTGGGGAELYPVVAEPFTAYAESVFHYVRVRVDGSTLVAQMIRDDGTIGDSVTIVKGEPPPAAICGDGLVNRTTEQCDGVDRPACVGACRADCTCAPACGDRVVNQASEACEASDDAACPGLCLAGCRCTDPRLVTSVDAIADTYIEAGSQASWDHGAVPRLEADGSPATFAYLKFDLSGIPRFVTGARLAVRCINESVNDATVYPVPDASWIEGTGVDATGAGGPGLKWVDVDTDGNDDLDARDASPYVPALARWLGFIPCAFGETATVDVTPAVAPEATVVSLAIGTDSKDAAQYASREAPAPEERPRLLLQLGGLKPTTTTTSSTSTSTTTITTSTTETTVTSSTSTTAEPTTTTTTNTSSTSSTTEPGATSTTSTSDTSSTTSTTSTTTTSLPASTTSTTVSTSTTSTTTTSTTSTSVTSSTTVSTVPTSTTTSSTTTTTEPIRPLCVDGGCDDDDPCTDDRCDPSTGCAHVQVEDFAAVRCRLTPQLTQPPACDGALMPPPIARAVGRAQTLVDRASDASSSRVARIRLRKAIRQVIKAGRIVRRRGDLPVDCAVAMAVNLEQARLQAEALARALKLAAA